jgi:hypothetical protein
MLFVALGRRRAPKAAAIDAEKAARRPWGWGSAAGLAWPAGPAVTSQIMQ